MCIDILPWVYMRVFYFRVFMHLIAPVSVGFSNEMHKTIFQKEFSKREKVGIENEKIYASVTCQKKKLVFIFRLYYHILIAKGRNYLKLNYDFDKI